MSEEITDTDRADFARYQATAIPMVEALIAACRVNDGQAGAEVTKLLFNSHDPQLLMLVLANLTTRIVSAEGHGPLTTLEKQGLTPSPTKAWNTALLDQSAAAWENGDYRTYARLALEGHMRAIAADELDPQFDVNFEHVLRAMMLFDQQTLALLATEAVQTIRGAT